MAMPMIRLALLAACLTVGDLRAQAPPSPPVGASSPEALATLVMRTFASGTPEAFAAIFPDSIGRVFMRSRAPKQADIARVVRRGSDRAVLLLAGTTTTGGGASQTNNARHFSGFYEAAESGGTWRVTRRIPFDTANHIRAQALSVSVIPGDRIDVVDTLTLSIGAPHGFGFRINNDVTFADVRLDGRPVEYAFGGGVVWIDAPPAVESRLVLTYSLAAARRGGDAGSAGAPAFGAFHNTDMWHPAFDYMSAHHLARFTAVVRIPAEYRLTTTIPQTDTVRNGVRTVYGATAHNEFLLALIFDRDWQPRTTDFGSFRFETFTTPAFRHSHDTLAARVKHVYDLLSPRFGEPKYPTRYLAAVEDRAIGARGGFSVAMNSAAISGGGGGGLGSERGQIFAHETGHAWTMNATGLAANFLREGWARFVESLVLRDLYGPAAELDYWETQRNAYMVGNDRGGWTGGFEGRQSILGDFDNGRIHYTKGSWILRAGNWVMGDSLFDRAMRSYIDGMGRRPGGHEALIAAWSNAAGHSMASFVMPWLTSRYIPDVEARVEGDRLIVTQEQRGENFDLPKLEIELTTASGTILRTIHLRQRADTLVIGDVGPVSEIRVDPHHRFLMHRKWGEIVRFELPAASLPDAQAVQLSANFLRQGVSLPATRHGDRWVVEVPLSAGRYIHVWSAVGETGERATGATDPALSGTRTVRALHRIQDAYPGR
jgi:hypothetical protein